MNEQGELFELQRWTGREYVPHGCALAYDPGELAGTARLLGLPAWRVVKRNNKRPARVRRWRPPISRSTGRTIMDVQKEYLAWARARGLDSVAWYGGRQVIPALDGFRLRHVDPAEHLGPAPAAETITDLGE